MREARAISLPGIGSYHRRFLLGMFAQPSSYWLLAAMSSAVAAAVMLTIDFGMEAVYVTETIAPLLAAFLAAFCLAPEYRGRALELVAYRAGFLRRVVLARSLMVMLASLGLVGLTLGLLSVVFSGANLPFALLVAFPSVWALSLLALTLALRFRSPWVGFAAAAGVWGLNVALGHGVHPLLGLQGFFAAQNLEPSGRLWLLNKLTLLAAGGLLLQLQARSATRGSQARPEPLRAAATIGALLALYTLSGACVVVAFAWLDQPAHGTNLPWLRGRMRALQATGIPQWFGPSFLVYVAGGADDPNSRQEILSRVRQLDEAVTRRPRSAWAPWMLLEKGRLLEQVDRRTAAQTYFELADRHPRTLIAQRALERVLQREQSGSLYGGTYVQYGSPEGFAAARKILEVYPRGDAARAANQFLETHRE